LAIKYGFFNKLDYQQIGPYPIKKQNNMVAYQLTLLASMKVHLVFHVSLQEPYKESNIPRRTQPLSPCIEIDNHDEDEVEEVLNSQQRRGRLEYLVHWRGYDINKRTWGPSTNLANMPKRIQGFHRRYPDKPKPLL
jgi:hypothetical protein